MRVATEEEAAILTQAFADWNTNRAYYTGGHYRLKDVAWAPLPRRSTAAPWSKLVVRLFTDVDAFHTAAKANEQGHPILVGDSNTLTWAEVNKARNRFAAIAPRESVKVMLVQPGGNGYPFYEMHVIDDEDDRSHEYTCISFAGVEATIRQIKAARKS